MKPWRSAVISLHIREETTLTGPSAIFLGINKVIAKALERENNGAATIYPCPVLNRYECPFDNCIKGNTITEHKDSKLINVNDLFNLSEIAFQVELAFAHAESMSRSNETVYEADFEADKVKEGSFFRVNSVMDTTEPEEYSMIFFHWSFIIFGII